MKNILKPVMAMLLLCLLIESHAQITRTKHQSITTKNKSKMKAEKEINKVFDNYVNYWNTQDMEKWSNLFTENTEFITWSRGWYISQKENYKNHQEAHEILKEQGQNMTYELKDIRINFLSSDIALVHAAWNWPNFKTKGVTENRSGRLTMVMIKTANNWLIRATQNTRTDKVAD